LHEVAIECNPTHKAFIVSAIKATATLQCVAAKSTKVENEQPPKQPLSVPADFLFGFCWICLIVCAVCGR
jgi:tryptophan-rich sensory protein